LSYHRADVELNGTIACVNLSHGPVAALQDKNKRSSTISYDAGFFELGQYLPDQLFKPTLATFLYKVAKLRECAIRNRQRSAGLVVVNINGEVMVFSVAAAAESKMTLS